MTAPKRPTHDLHAAVLAAVAAFGAGALAAAVWPRRQHDPVPTDPVLTLDAAGYRYSYQVVTGDELLFDLLSDPRELRDLSASRPLLTRELRRALETKLGVRAIDTLRKGETESIRKLRSLGCL